ncbi:MAG: GH92 family glycosyl hydrolase [Bacteroidales bacterium]|nr:GH92 family glycosyl hydrolase [Bacteroidales bacterium]
MMSMLKIVMKSQWLILIIGLSLFSCKQNRFAMPQNNSQYIDPTIGNVAQFLKPTYPTIHLPNQMLRMFPIKTDYLSDQVEAFPFQVMTHRANGVYQMKIIQGKVTTDSWKQKMAIDHDLEVFHPWLYSTYLIDEGIRLSFTPGSKAAIYKLEFNSVEDRHLLISGTNELKSTLTEGNWTLKDAYKYTTRGTEPTTRTMYSYVYAEIRDIEGKLIEDIRMNKDGNRVVLSIPNNASKTLFLQYAISYIDENQAKDNFEKELEGISFDALMIKGQNAWEEKVSQIQVVGGTVAQKRTFYTSLYRTYERMIDINEYGRYFSGYDGKVHQDERSFFVDDWIWDSYRAHHPLRTILDPKAENDMLNSYTLMYEQSGWMPTFPQVHGNHMCMNSYHSSAIFIDGYRKGFRDYDIEKAYEGIKKNLTEGTFIPWRQGVSKRPIDDFFHQHGYFPSLAIGEKETEPMMDKFEKRQPVPVTLGISYDFWALSELAKELGKNDDVKQFAPRAKDYQNLWHNQSKLFIPKDKDGNWLKIDPKLSGGLGYREYYDENNGWTYAWDVQHDIAGLTALLGGKDSASTRLDQLFREPLGTQKSLFYVDGSNSTGMVGQFSMGNEPSFHIPYLYNYFGTPWKTQQRTRFLLDVWFKDNVFGIPGDEDGGGMTAFVVFSSMGLYPVEPGRPYYTITSPIFEEVAIRLQNGKEFKVIAKGASKKNKYIQKAFIDGKEIFSPFITHEQIMAGVTLELILDELPNRNWGKEAILPSWIETK